MSFAAGQIIQHRYVLEGRLGEGGMGTSYLAWDQVREARVTLKLLRSGALPLFEALKAEFTRLRGLLHPHLCRVNDFGVISPDGAPRLAFYTADYVEGQTLDRFAAGRRFAEVAIPLAHALHALGVLHRLGVRHGDFKPENILVDAAGRGVLIDLGCSAPIPEDAAEPRRISGTPAFLAPEILEGGRADARADLFAVGVTLERLAALAGPLPEPVARLAERLRRRAPADRPGDVQELLEVLDPTSLRAAAPLAAPPRLLGRRAEMDRFERALSGLLAGAPGPRALLVTGPSGIGRTRLLQEMKWVAQLRCDVVEGEARRGAAVASMLRRAIALGDGKPGLAGVIEARDRLRSRPSPVVLLLDDADALEGAEREDWIALLRSVEPSDPFLLVASEAGPVPVEAEAVDGVVLSPLGLDDLLAWTAGAIAPSRGPALARLTGGFPASIQALVALVSGGDVGEEELEGLASHGELVGRRLAGLRRLDPGERRALGLVAATGGALGPRDAAALGLDLDTLGRLAQRGWISPDAAGYRLTRMAEAASILRDLDPPLRAELHRIAAAHLAPRLRAQDGAPAGACAARLVRHLCLAGLPEEAWAAAREHRALAAAHPDVFGEAMRALAAAVPGAEAQLFAAEIHEAAGRPAEALSLLARLLRARPPAAVRDEVRLRAAAAYVKMGDGRRARTRTERALRAESSPPARARALDLASRAAIKLGLWAEAAAHAREGLALVAATPAADVEADLHDDLGVAASYLGDLDAARTHLERAATLHAEAGRPRAEARSASYRALADYRGGDAGAAARGFRRALAIAESSGAVDLVANAALNLGTACHQLGDLGEALGSYEQGLALAVALGKTSTEATLRANLAKLFADLGADARAEPAARRAEARADELGMGLLAGAAGAALGEILLQRGDAVAALASFQRARERFARDAAAREVAETDLHLGDAHLALGDLDAAERRGAEATAAAERLGADDLLARARLLRGRVRSARGRWAEGLDDLEDAARLAGRAAQRALAAEIEARLADALRARGASVRARRHAESACELWERTAATLPAHLADAFWAHPLRSGRREALLPPPPADGSIRERKLERLLAINRRLSASLEASEVLALAVDSAMELSGAERGFVLLAPARRADGELEVLVARNLDAAAASEDLVFSKGIAERVLASGEPLLTVDAAFDQRFAENASVHAMRLKSVMCAPIRAAEGIAGALYLDHRFHRGLFAASDLDLLMAFADQVAIALTNARLHAELGRRTGELVAERQRIEQLLRGQDEEIDRLTEAVKARQEALEHRYEYGRIAGRSAAMQAIFRTLDRVIDTPATVLIEGESGTGKELIARAIHYNSARKGGPFVSINCGALPEALLESELFGFVRGAFTGAHRDREGLLSSARGGTLLLDELGEMPHGMQVKLLRVLQEREVVPLGSHAPTPIDVRVVCATNRQIRGEVAAGRFREDLYYRLGVVEIRVPPLRERIEDLPEIAARILAASAETLGRPAPRLAKAALRALLAHAWPGNVRELENVLTKAALMAEGDTLGPEDLELPAPAPAASAVVVDRSGFLHEEEGRILAVLRACRWNVSEAQKTLGIPRATLYRKLKRYGVERPEERGGKGKPERT
jgi:transcriptional regulator with GAF, ATPase, and Fis domain